MSTATPPLDAYLHALRETIDAALARALPREAPAVIVDAMAYTLLAGGKRLRPCVTLAAAEAVAARDGHRADQARVRALPAACAVELVHTYSLIHDDLPAMDDDTLRRGRPTTHVIYGDGLAVLAGDGLLTEAFGLLSRAPDSGGDAPSADVRLRALAVLAEAAGARGMVGGQAIDLCEAGRVLTVAPVPLAAEGLADMHRRKTGALIRAAAVMGALLAGGDEPTLDAIDRYAAELGLAFQIIDDLLDVEGSAAQLGKTAGKDADAGKPTYPAVFGIERSRQMAAECVARAKTALADARLGGRLAEIADWSLTRRA